MEQEEQWKPVLGYEGYYEVSSLGRVRSLDRSIPSSIGSLVRVKGKMLTPCTVNRRYAMVILSAPGKKRNRTVHSIVAEAFIGPRPDGAVVNHIDGVKKNNVPSNLEYVTQKQNIRHAIDTGLRVAAKGEGHYRSNLKESDIVAIRSAFASGVMGTVLAAQYGISNKGISQICRRKSWAHVA